MHNNAIWLIRIPEWAHQRPLHPHEQCHLAYFWHSEILTLNMIWFSTWACSFGWLQEQQKQFPAYASWTLWGQIYIECKNKPGGHWWVAGVWAEPIIATTIDVVVQCICPRTWILGDFYFEIDFHIVHTLAPLEYLHFISYFVEHHPLPWLTPPKVQGVQDW